MRKPQAYRQQDRNSQILLGQNDDPMEISSRKWIAGNRSDRKLRLYFEPGGKLENDAFRIGAPQVSTSHFSRTARVLI